MNECHLKIAVQVFQLCVMHDPQQFTHISKLTFKQLTSAHTTPWVPDADRHPAIEQLPKPTIAKETTWNHQSSPTSRACLGALSFALRAQPTSPSTLQLPDRPFPPPWVPLSGRSLPGIVFSHPRLPGIVFSHPRVWSRLGCSLQKGFVAYCQLVEGLHVGIVVAQPALL